MAKSNKIYLDYAASAKANPSSVHSFGVGAKIKLQNARRKVSDVLGARPEEIIFTSGGTESNNLAIQGVVWNFWELSSQVGAKLPSELLPHVITTNIEHPSVMQTFAFLQRRKLAQVSIVAVEPDGIVDPKKIKKEIKENTVLVSVMYANNEIGTVQPIQEIAKAIRHYKKTNKRDNILFHTDAVQAVNYLSLKVEKLGVDLLSLSGSKIEGAGRVGVLYKKKTTKLAKVFGGGDQEMRLRPGTENLPEISKFAAALESVEHIKQKENKRLVSLRDYFIKKLLALFSSEELIINGDLQNRLPNNVNLTFSKIPSDLLVIELSAKGIMVSSKSACKSSSEESSYVIKALRPESDGEIGGIRFSMGRQTSKRDIDYTLQSLSEILTKLKKWYD